MQKKKKKNRRTSPKETEETSFHIKRKIITEEQFKKKYIYIVQQISTKKNPPKYPCLHCSSSYMLWTLLIQDIYMCCRSIDAHSRRLLDKYE